MKLKKLTKFQQLELALLKYYAGIPDKHIDVLDIFKEEICYNSWDRAYSHMSFDKRFKTKFEYKYKKRKVEEIYR